MHGGKRKAGKAHDGERDECGCRADEAVERIGGVDRGKGCDRTSGCQNRGHVGIGKDRQGKLAVAAAQYLAAGKQGGGKQRGKNDARPGSEQPGLDGGAHQQDCAQRRGKAAKDDRPAAADHAFQIAPWASRNGWRRQRLRARGNRNFLVRDFRRNGRGFRLRRLLQNFADNFRWPLLRLRRLGGCSGGKRHNFASQRIRTRRKAGNRRLEFGNARAALEAHDKAADRHDRQADDEGDAQQHHQDFHRPSPLGNHCSRSGRLRFYRGRFNGAKRSVQQNQWEVR